MKIRKCIGLLILIVAIILTVGCSNQNTLKGKSAKEILEYHFKTMNDKNVNEYVKTISERKKNNSGEINFDYLESIKIINVEEETDSNYKKSYLHNGSGRDYGITEDDVKVYKVKFDVKYKEGAITSQDSGIDAQWFYAIRKTSDSQWVIDDSGY